MKPFLKHMSAFLRKSAALLVLLPLVCGCARQTDTGAFNQVSSAPEEMIVLQNLKTRVLAYCYGSPAYSAEECVQKFEAKGFVQLKDIPRFPAEDDFLKADTYPTRRWRKDEAVPRW